MPTKSYGPTAQTSQVTSQLRAYLSSTTCGNTGSLTIQDTTTRVTGFDYSAAKGTTIPGWRKLRNSGAILPMTSWDQVTIHAVCSPAVRKWCNSAGRPFEWTNWYTGIDNTSPWASLPWEPSYLTSMAESDLDLQYYVQKAASKIYSSGWDALTFLAEINQLRRMLTGIVKKLSDLLRDVKKADYSKLDRYWLEGRYGWRTLLYDIQDLHEVLSRANERRTRYRQATGASSSGQWTTSSTSTSSGLTTEQEYQFSWVLNQRGTVVADIEVPDFQFNPVTTAWEVTRLSFVIDWLWNVGQALEAASFLLMAKHYRACGGYKVDIDIVGTTSLVSLGTNRSATISGTVNGTCSVVKRVPMTVSALPRMKLRLDQYKVLDLLAIIMQIFKRK